MGKIKVLLADDHGVVRKGIKMLIDDDPSIEIIGETSAGDETIEQTKSLLPDILITDISMPGLSGIEVTKIITKDLPDVKVLVLSTHHDEEYIVKSFEAGAMGYLPKDSEENEIIDAVKSISKGKMYYTKFVSDILARSMLRKSSPKYEEDLALTDRELEILRCIVDGLNNREIADKLFISARTVDTHRRNIMKKLNTKNTAELVRIAMEKKLTQSS
ncbi:MAG: response regulator transcription factor [Bacteroidota bacterium]